MREFCSSGSILVYLIKKTKTLYNNIRQLNVGIIKYGKVKYNMKTFCFYVIIFCFLEDDFCVSIDLCNVYVVYTK